MAINLSPVESQPLPARLVAVLIARGPLSTRTKLKKAGQKKNPTSFKTADSLLPGFFKLFGMRKAD
jgi:hypothetical protein